MINVFCVTIMDLLLRVGYMCVHRVSSMLLLCRSGKWLRRLHLISPFSSTRWSAMWCIPGQLQCCVIESDAQCDVIHWRHCLFRVKDCWQPTGWTVSSVLFVLCHLSAWVHQWQQSGSKSSVAERFTDDIFRPFNNNASKGNSYKDSDIYRRHRLMH